MATKFPKFSQDLAQDPTTRRIWYGIATAHDFESHDGMTEENLYQKIFASHFGHLAIIFLWTSGNLFHVAWQGNFEQWIKDPLNVRPIAHAIWDPHFGQPAVDAFTQAGASNSGKHCLLRCVSLVVHHRDADKHRPVHWRCLSAAAGGGLPVRRLAAPSAQVPPQLVLV